MSEVRTILQDANNYLSKAELSYKAGDHKEAADHAQIATAFLLMDIAFRLMEANGRLERIEEKLEAAQP
jgi:HEPN domain-containing protein